MSARQGVILRGGLVALAYVAALAFGVLAYVGASRLGVRCMP